MKYICHVKWDFPGCNEKNKGMFLDKERASETDYNANSISFDGISCGRDCRVMKVVEFLLGQFYFHPEWKRKI